MYDITKEKMEMEDGYIYMEANLSPYNLPTCPKRLRKREGLKFGRGFFKKREREFFQNFSSIFSLFLRKKK